LEYLKVLDFGGQAGLNASLGTLREP
jgi:hypothetical protein